MNSRTQWMEDIQKNISDLIARSPAADVEKNVRAMMAQAFTKMDLVTREEFDVQADLLGAPAPASTSWRRRCSNWKSACRPLSK